MDRLMREIWKESSYKDAIREHARKTTARRMARVALEKRFGSLSDDVLAAIQAADEATLEEVVGSNSLAEARKHLGLS